MAKLKRFGVSLSSDLLDKFDKLIDGKGYRNRSEAIRDLIRENLVSEEWKSGNKETVGVFSLVYDHHESDISQLINNIQHDNLNIIRSSTHVHIDHHNCLEVIILKGKSKEIKKLTDQLSSTKGIKHGKLIMTSTGSGLT
ncbi:MAG: nickel-responsive transcriptional regulator NikR [Acidobacteriota bacterium]